MREIRVSYMLLSPQTVGFRLVGNGAARTATNGFRISEMAVILIRKTQEALSKVKLIYFTTRVGLSQQ